MQTLTQPTAFSRRSFLFGASAALSGLSAAPASAFPFLRKAQQTDAAETRSLLMINQQTEEVFHEVYFDGRVYIADSLARFALFARDLRTGELGEMDPHLLDLAFEVQQRAGADEPLILTHGFRSSSRSVRGGAANSHHLYGQALDITHHRLGPRGLHEIAASIGRGGLSRYSSFIHIDTGATRTW
ncbi:YcbK family protein [Roseinatronobacter alkalisoli]|uniref:Murein endopeptidase K n=1 Tax=Roseinatronobacter alkalisoli TaxID=3028235 RepID=A0ABT5T8P4_9RHOB|nr:DUF882 domain-containing protein [Roseinatronobacter sp. HJB301]MDD7970741.1 DUF882 domain-containing protein [Roseinatronobacter sp. HJB301]